MQVETCVKQFNTFQKLTMRDWNKKSRVWLIKFELNIDIDNNKIIKNIHFPRFIKQNDVYKYNLKKKKNYHWFLSCWSDKISVTILAPWTGGLEYIGLIIILICDITRSTSSLSLHTTVKFPALSPVVKQT